MKTTSERFANQLSRDEFAESATQGFGENGCTAALRRAIVEGKVTPLVFHQWLAGLPRPEWDTAVDELLGLEPFVADATDLPSGCVPYIPAPVSAIVRLIENVDLVPQATFVDVGCGVGRAAILVHLLTGATVLGVEIQAHLVDIGEAAAQRLGLTRVTFLQGDACDEPLSEAAVYFLYCPFDASRVRRLLSRLECHGRARDIVVACLQTELPECAWLRPIQTDFADLRLFGSAAS